MTDVGPQRPSVGGLVQRQILTLPGRHHGSGDDGGWIPWISVLRMINRVILGVRGAFAKRRQEQA